MLMQRGILCLIFSFPLTGRRYMQLVRSGGKSYEVAINNLETESIDPELEAHYEKILDEWKKDEDYRKGMLDKIIREVGNVGKKVDDLAVVPNKGW